MWNSSSYPLLQNSFWVGIVARVKYGLNRFENYIYRIGILENLLMSVNEFSRSVSVSWATTKSEQKPRWAQWTTADASRELLVKEAKIYITFRILTWRYDCLQNVICYYCCILTLTKRSMRDFWDRIFQLCKQEDSSCGFRSTSRLRESQPECMGVMKLYIHG